MTSTAVMHQGTSHEQLDSKLRDELERFNAQYPHQSTEHFPEYKEDVNDLGLYDNFEGVYSNEHSYVHNAPTPRSNTTSEGVRTRSGRSTGTRTDSPFSTSKSRVSKSPGPKKEKKSKLDKSKLPKLTAPLSVLTEGMDVPVKDTEAFVNRPVAVRLQEVAAQGGYIKRPQNSFILYRSAYADRCKKWCEQHNHQIVSSVAGQSWPLESEEVRNRFDEWAKIERQHHQEAHPKYKFSPSKTSTKRRKGEMTDDEDETSDLDDRDPDGEYRGGRQVRQRRQDRDAAYLPSNVGFGSHPYYDQHVGGYEQTHFRYAQPGRPLASNVAYDPHTGQQYHTQTHTWIQASPQQQYAQSPYMYQEVHAAPRVPTPASMQGQQSTMGSLGLPGGSGPEDIFSNSRTSTPQQYAAQQYSGNMYGQPVYPQYQYQQHPYQVAPSTSATPQPGSQQYEHAQYLTQHQDVVDPTLQGFQMDPSAAAGPGGNAGESHFDDALGDMTDGELSAMHMAEYYEQNSTSPVDGNATLAPTWNPAQELK
ncbi:Putative High mobility group box domain-containing protein [Septoria linicola]|uniref:High mobility group box domain-containing protein n=1 Tax=Septoria linicola TaxID=215465 RepID=A0A9Q9AKW6_9PEZI|nr:Putative High mobility group box domain-containing protein [Septoria linicola]